MTSINHVTLLTSVLDDYLAFRDASLSDSAGLFKSVLTEWTRISSKIAARNREQGTSFNPLSQIRIGETSHSRLLGNLLNPRGSHGQGTLFLDVFLRRIGYPVPETDSWNVTVETGRVDILIWRNTPEKSAIIIENKSNNAADQLNQIYRYWHREMYLWDRGLWDKKDEGTKSRRTKNFHIIYLPTDGGRSVADHSLQRPADWSEKDNPHLEVPIKSKNLTLHELTAAWLNEALPLVPSTNSRLRDFITHYHELWIS
jgi:hypothetical protein